MRLDELNLSIGQKVSLLYIYLNHKSGLESDSHDVMGTLQAHNRGNIHLLAREVENTPIEHRRIGHYANWLGMVVAIRKIPRSEGDVKKMKGRLRASLDRIEVFSGMGINPHSKEHMALARFFFRGRALY
jgi:hypothetical protein